MRTLLGFGLVVLLAGAAYGQRWNPRATSTGGFGNVVSPGFGRPLSSGFGNVVFPGTGRAPKINPFLPSAQSFASRLGGTVSGAFPYTGGFGGFRGRAPVVIPYAYPVFLGGGYYSPYGYPDQPEQPNVTVVYPPQQAPVTIINQVPGAASAPTAPQQQTEPEAPDTRSELPPAASQALSSEASYYLIALKDHTIYSAVAYWVEGDTLHYFTKGNVHNQASLSLVDRELTDRLNRERDVTIRLP